MKSIFNRRTVPMIDFKPELIKKYLRDEIFFRFFLILADAQDDRGGVRQGYFIGMLTVTLRPG